MSKPASSREDNFSALAESCLGLTRALLEKHRYRIAGAPACRRAAHEIAGLFRESCDSVAEETFTLHPRALWFVGRAVAIAYLLSATGLVLGGGFLYLAALVSLLGLAYALVQYIFYGRFFDRFFKSAEGGNVVGVLEPERPAARQVVFVGHHDSPYIFSFLERFQSVAFIRFLLGMLAYAWVCAYSLAAGLQGLLSGSPQAVAGLPFWITLIGLPFALQLFFMMSKVPSPGAGDNLNSVSMLASLAGYFRSERENGSPLKDTRLIFLSSDGEEIGQRGAIQYAESHRAQLHEKPTFVFNIDSVYHIEDIQVLTRDRNFTCKLSAAMAADICEIAGEMGLPLKKAPLPFGGGGTDAAAFAVTGIEAASIIGVPTGMVSRDRLYHTSRDTVENIQADAVRAILELAVGYVRRVDGQAEKSSV